MKEQDKDELNSSTLTTMSNSVWSQLGGLQSGIESCAIMMENIQDWYSVEMFNSVLNMIQYFKEIRIRYVSVLSPSATIAISKVNSVAHWEFTIEDGYLRYDLERFALYDIIRTCYIGFINIDVVASGFKIFHDEYNIIKYINTHRWGVDRQNSLLDSGDFKRIGYSYVPQFKTNVLIDWSSFRFMGKAVRKYFANSLHTELNKVLATRCYNSHVPMKVNTLVIANANKQNVGITYSTDDTTLRINVFSTRTTAGQWGVDTMDIDNMFTSLERQQILESDMSNWDKEIMTSSETNMSYPASLNVSHTLIQELVLRARSDGLTHLVHDQKNIQEWISTELSRYTTAMKTAFDYLLENQGNCSYLGECNIPSGLWKMEHLFDSSKSIHPEDTFLQFSLDLGFEPIDMSSVTTKGTLIWRLFPFGINTLGKDYFSMISLNKRLYYSPDGQALSNVLMLLPKRITPCVPSATENMTFKSQGFYSKNNIHEDELLKQLIPAKPNPYYLFPAMSSIFDMWNIYLSLGIDISLNMEELRSIWGQDIIQKISSLSYSLIKTIENLADNNYIKNIYMKTLNMIIIGNQCKQRSEITVNDKRLPLNVLHMNNSDQLTIKFNKSGVVYLEMYKTDTRFNLEYSVLTAVACLRRIQLQREIQEILMRNDLNVEVEVRALRHPNDFNIYMMNSFSIIEILESAMSFIMKTYLNPKAIILNKAKTICLDPNDSAESTYFILLQDDILHFKVPVHVSHRVILCVEQLLVKYPTARKTSNNTLFEAMIINNRLAFYSGGILFRYKAFSNNIPHRESLTEHLRKQLKIFSHTNDNKETPVEFKIQVINDDILMATFAKEKLSLRYRCDLGELKQIIARKLIKLTNRTPLSMTYLMATDVFLVQVHNRCHCHPSRQVVIQEETGDSGKVKNIDVTHDQFLKVYAGGVIFKVIGRLLILTILSPETTKSCLFSIAAYGKILMKASCHTCGKSSVFRTHMGTFGGRQWLPVYFLTNDTTMRRR